MKEDVLPYEPCSIGKPVLLLLKSKRPFVPVVNNKKWFQ